MKRIALAPLILALLTFAPAASADHGHNCVWSGGAWVGQGLCPGMPGYGDPHPTPTPTAEPTPTSTPTVTTPAPSPTSTTPAPAPTTSTQTPTSTPTSTSTPATPRPTRTPGCLTSYGNVWCTGGATPSTGTSSPTPDPEQTERVQQLLEERAAEVEIVTGPLIETDIVGPYAPEVNPARILRK